MFVITGATGNIGAVLAEKLLDGKQKVRAIARSADRLKRLADRGADIAAGSLDDSKFLTRAFQGATAAFTMIPLDLKAQNVRTHQDHFGEAITSAIKQARPSYVMNLSSVGGHLPEGTGPIAGLHAQEERLNRIEGIHILHLRPAWFMENLLGNIPLIKHMGINGSSMRGDLSFSMIATRDIASAATEHLLKLDFTGQSIHDLLGQRDLTMTEATTILGKAIGRPDLPYVQFSYEDAQKGMVQAGLPEDVARSLNEMARAFNEGLIAPVPRTLHNTTPTSIEDFANVFAAAYNA